MIGLSLPNMNKPYVHDGIVQTVVLWNTADLGYLTVHAAAQLAQGNVPPGARAMTAGRLGASRSGLPKRTWTCALISPKQNIDRYDF